MTRKRKYINKTKRSRLVLEAKVDERFMLYDCRSGLYTTIKVFYRNNGNLAIAFEAPKDVRISREQQRSVKDGIE
jgi:sRNA-binding carbon storage regulator CsrA